MDERIRLKRIGSYASGNVLDIGCAANPNPYLKNVIGMDLNDKVKLPSNYIKLVSHNVHEKFPFKDNTFDTVVAGEILEHLENPFAFLRECKRVVKKGGRVIITTPNSCYLPIFFCDLFMIKRFYFQREYGLYSGEVHLHHFTPRMLDRMFHYCGLKIIRREGIPYLPLPIPRNLRYQLLYIGTKQISGNKP
ncbi:methyltransferase domain-containing protein [Candidatus Woesearchaeota archaeon]|nr:methyltransferase domain-containing protein [Candidatus Woesearchaeota archaeon]